VFATFDGSEWHPLSYRAGTRALERPNSPAQLQVEGAPLRYEVTLEPHKRPWLLVLDAVRDSPQRGWHGRLHDGRPAVAHQPPDHRRAALPGDKLPAVSPRPDTATPALRAYTELPPGFNPRTLALAQELRSDPRFASDSAPDTARDATPALVNAALTRLRTGGYTYTLEPGVYGQHTADEFWFDRKEGFCEHIASAFVVLMRAMDVPARIVTGYQGGDRNTVDGYWTVRQSDAHAWAEVWMAGRGWVRVDPTSAVAPGRTGPLSACRRPRALATAMGTVMSPGWRKPARHVGGREQRLEPVGAELHAKPPARPAQGAGFESPSWQDLTTCWARWWGWPRWAAPAGRCGSAASTTPGCACWPAPASAWPKAG
jgi:transglutaminase-like putative cysteine protease